MNNEMINTRVKDIVIQLRKMKNLTQEHLAELSEVNVRTIQRLEKTGAYSPETLRAVAEAFDVDCQVILAIANLPAGEQNAEIEKKYLRVRLVEVTNGKMLTDKIGTVNMLQPDYPPDLDKAQATATGELLDFMSDYLDIKSDLSPSENISQEGYFTDYLQNLRKLGLRVFSGCVKRSVVFKGDNGAPMPMTTAVVLIVRDGDKKIVETVPGTGFVDALLERNGVVQF